MGNSVADPVIIGFPTEVDERVYLDTPFSDWCRSLGKPRSKRREENDSDAGKYVRNGYCAYSVVGD